MATQPITIIKGALRSIGALATGETPDADTANDAFLMLNDMLDQWSNERMMVFAVQEVMHELASGQYQYTIGQAGADVGCIFTASIAVNTMTVTGVTSGALSVGQQINATGVTAGTTITSYGTGRGGNSTGALGTYFLNLPNTFASGTAQSFAPRPLRINSAIVRVTTSVAGSLDYPVAVINLEDYELIGIKTLNGPWPRAVYYQPTEPMGVLTYWPNPNQVTEMHLFADSLLTQFNTLTDTITLPQGYNLAMRFGLAELLMPEFGKADQGQVSMIMMQAAAGRAWIKRTNMQPLQTAHFDDVLVARRGRDAGWILHGGFN